MHANVERPLRGFVGISLAIGGVALLAGARIFQDLGLLPAWFPWAVLAWALVLGFLPTVARLARWPWTVPAAVLVLSLMVGVFWAHWSSEGHDALSLLAPFVAFATGVGILRRERWAWPVAFTSVTGFGPFILVLAAFPDVVLYPAIALFVLDAGFLLALLDSFFQKPAWPGSARSGA